jgi:hypothetical protein
MAAAALFGGSRKGGTSSSRDRASLRRTHVVIPSSR